MNLERMNILNFKNITEACVEFSRSVDASVGVNGAGQTNIIEAVYYLSFC
jgi:DNA replication and repair protein RecF